MAIGLQILGRSYDDCLAGDRREAPPQSGHIGGCGCRSSEEQGSSFLGDEYGGRERIARCLLKSFPEVVANAEVVDQLIGSALHMMAKLVQGGEVHARRRRPANADPGERGGRSVAALDIAVGRVRWHVRLRAEYSDIELVPCLEPGDRIFA